MLDGGAEDPAIFGEHIASGGLAHWWYPGYGVRLSVSESYRSVISKDPITSGLLIACVHPGAWGSPWYPAHLRFSPNGCVVRAEATPGVTDCDTLAIAADGIGGMVLACKEMYDGVFMYRVAQDGATGLYHVRIGGLAGVEQATITGLFLGTIFAATGRIGFS